MAGTSLIGTELQSLQNELGILSLIIAKRNQTPLDEIEIRGAALSLAALYNGMERILKQILIDRNEAVTESPNWHSVLLQKSRTLQIIGESTLQDMKGFMSFRHFVRHAYSYEINPEAINAILDAAPELVERFTKEIKESLRSENQ
jgi:hypothetical protein